MNPFPNLMSSQRSCNPRAVTVLLATGPNLPDTPPSQVFGPHVTLYVAQNGFEAWQYVKEHDPSYFDVIVLAAMMPFMDGFEACSLIHEYLHEFSVQDIIR